MVGRYDHLSGLLGSSWVGITLWVVVRGRDGLWWVSMIIRVVREVGVGISNIISVWKPHYI